MDDFKHSYKRYPSFGALKPSEAEEINMRPVANLNARSMPAFLLTKFERALGVDGAYQFFCSLSQDQVDAIVRTAIMNEWIRFSGDWHDA